MKVILTDTYGRTFPYLRLSVTEVCNFRCSYCLPNGYEKTGEEKNQLSVDEIRRLVTAFTSLGTNKVRLTGGEPSTRKDLLEVAKTVANIPGIQTVALTTNGYKLDQKAKAYKEAGINHINISIDSLNREKFRQITGHNRLQEVLDGAEACLKEGVKTIKMNTVLLKEINDTELGDFQNYVKNKAVDWRFIELMQTNDNQDYFKQHHQEGSVLSKKLLAEGWVPEVRQSNAGPAINYSHADYQGKMGLIRPYNKDFCQGCNRLRVSSQGALQLCLFGEGRHDLRPLLQHDDQIEELKILVQQLLRIKPESHNLHKGQSGSTRYLAAIGG